MSHLKQKSLICIDYFKNTLFRAKPLRSGFLVEDAHIRQEFWILIVYVQNSPFRGKTPKSGCLSHNTLLGQNSRNWSVQECNDTLRANITTFESWGQKSSSHNVSHQWRRRRRRRRLQKKWQLKLTAADIGFNVKPKILNLCVIEMF